MAMMSDVELPAAHIRNQVASAIDVVVQLARFRDGRRVVWEIAAVEGTHRGEPVVSPLFRLRQDGEDGGFEATGAVPRVAHVLADRGEDVGDWLFEEGPDR
jgi:pilus assembly protein CpaF